MIPFSSVLALFEIVEFSVQFLDSSFIIHLHQWATLNGIVHATATAIAIQNHFSFNSYTILHSSVSCLFIPTHTKRRKAPAFVIIFVFFFFLCDFMVCYECSFRLYLVFDVLYCCFGASQSLCGRNHVWLQMDVFVCWSRVKVLKWMKNYTMILKRAADSGVRKRKQKKMHTINWTSHFFPYFRARQTTLR